MCWDNTGNKAISALTERTSSPTKAGRTHISAGAGKKIKELEGGEVQSTVRGGRGLGR